MMVTEIHGVLSDAERHEQMRKAIGRFPFLKKRDSVRNYPVSIACYGPSLRETWRTIERPIISVSGAHDFLIERNIVPDWHVEIDPRPHKPLMLTRPNRYTRYLMASVCHPDFWDILKNLHVSLWHLINDQATLDWVKEYHPEGLDSTIGGGSTVGQRALNVGAAALGFRRFNVYGMDCSFNDLGERHAGPHTGPPESIIRIDDLYTTPQLLQAANEMRSFLSTMDAEVHFHGDGLLHRMAKGMATI